MSDRDLDGRFRRYLEVLGYELQCVNVKRDRRVTISL